MLPLHGAASRTAPACLQDGPTASSTADLSSNTYYNELTTFITRAFRGPLLTCKAIYAEAVPILYKQNNFVFFNIYDLDHGLGTLAPSREKDTLSTSPGNGMAGELKAAEQAFKTLSQMSHLLRLEILVHESQWSAHHSATSNEPFTVKRIPGFTAMQIRGILESSMTKPLAPSVEKKRQTALGATLETGAGTTKKMDRSVGAGEEAEQVSVDTPRKARRMARGRKAKGA